MKAQKAIYRVISHLRPQVLHGTVQISDSRIIFESNPIKDETPEIRIEIEINKTEDNG